jgi:hypothetical protein
MKLQKKQSMTPEELVAARRRLDESGPPACVEAYALRAAATRAYRTGGEDGGHKAIAALLEHQHGCAVCRAEPESLKAYGSPDPGDVPWGSRVLGRMGPLIERLLRVLLGPSPARGEYRRLSFVVSLLLSAVAVGGIGASTLMDALTGRLDAADLRERALMLAALIPAYVVGSWLAGAAWDATRRIRHRFAGYLLRGGATAGAMYGAVGLIVPLANEDLWYKESPMMLGMLTVAGVLLGAGKWIKDRLTDNIPAPVRASDERSADAG